MTARSELARSYMLAGRLKEAEETFRFINSKTEVDIDAVIMWSQALRALGRMDEAFDALHRVRDKYWEDKDFLGMYLTCGYSSGHEQEAHEALMALDDLRKKGLLEPDRLRQGTVEDLLALNEEKPENVKRISANSC